MKKLTTPRMRYPLLVDDHRKRIKDHDLRTYTWNVRSLNWEGAAAQLVDVLVRTKADITAVQEVFNVWLICAHVPTEEKDDLAKDAFYERCPRDDVKIVLGDFSGRVGKEGIFGVTASTKKHPLMG